MRILVAGVGDVVHGDDGFGVAVVRHLRAHATLPARGHERVTRVRRTVNRTPAPAVCTTAVAPP